MKTKYRNLILLLTLILALAMVFSACKKESDESSGDTKIAEKEKKLTEEEVEELINKDYENGISFEEEVEGYKVQVKKEDTSKFIGKWEATSGHSHYLLGNLDLDIKAGGAWKGNVTGDDVSGTWTEQDGGIYIKCNDPGYNFSGQLVFTPQGALLFRYNPIENSDEPLNVVLTKK